jgi:hypothetical protein
MTYRFTPEASVDLFAAAAFYDSRQEGLGAEFAVDTGFGIARIVDAPNRWPDAGAGCRKYRLDRFPYALIYRLPQARIVEIVAVFDLRRRPGAWRRNLKS